LIMERLSLFEEIFPSGYRPATHHSCYSNRLVTEDVQV
jgi:hypothetical protein